MSDLRLVQLSNYVRPDIYENKSKNWVLNGRKNEFYQYVIDRNNGSPTNGSINKSYADLIYGRGLTAKNSRQNIEDWARVKSILSPKELRKICTDFQVFNEASFQIVTTRGGDLSQITHLPKQKVAPSCENEDGEIEDYWYCKDWTNTNKYPPVSYPAYGSSSKALQIYVVRPYGVGQEYYSQPDYTSGLMYAEMEEEIANLNINSIKQGLSAGYMINIPDGKSLTDEEKDTFERKIKQKLTGSGNASNFILSFNGRDVEVTIVPFPTNDNIHKQWETLNETATTKILTSHRAVSPSLVGIVSSSGFSNTADEMREAETQTYRRVIKPKQEQILSALEEVFVEYGINLELDFLPLTKEEKEVQAELSAEQNINEMEHILERYAEDTPEGFELHSSELVSLSAIQNSEQDTDLWKIRYAYVEGTNKTRKTGKSRPFCTKMRALEIAGKVFRKEDILQMGDDGVNSSFGHNKQPYSIWLYGGGVNCYHRWERRMFKKKEQPDGELYKGNPMQNVTPTNVKEARRQGAKIPKNAADVAKAEIDKANRGAYPS